MKALFVFLFFLSGSGLLAQEVAQIRGSVLDAETGKPIPFASVYFNSTSIGATADSVGNYALKNVPIHYTDLVFSSIGYETFFYKVSLTAQKIVTLVVKLKPSKKSLHEIVVKGKRDHVWKDNYERFLKEFIGSGPNASQCKIENPEVLNFYFSEDMLKASASHPLEVTNLALGYKINVSLEQFALGLDYYRISFHSRFQKLEAKDGREEFRWQVNRSNSYRGSLRHFLKALIETRGQAEGFRVYRPVTARLRNGSQVNVRPTGEVLPEILCPQKVPNGELPGYYRLMKRGVIEIHYLNTFTPKSKRVYPDFPHPVSWLEISDEYLLCPFTGIIKSNANAMISGEMARRRLADALPEDYDPLQDEGNIYLAKHLAQTGTIHGAAIDSASGKPLTGALIFINNSLFKTTSYLGQFELNNIPQGSYTVVATYGSYCAEGRKIEVRGDSVSNVRFLLPTRAYQPWVEPPTFQELETQDLKRMYFTDHFVNWHSFSTKISNMNVLEIKFSKDKALMRSSGPLEIVDNRTGYKLSYFLKEAEVQMGRNGKSSVHGFASFDTLTARSLSEREKWMENRNEIYRGSLGHLVRSVAEGRSKEEGFNIYSLNSVAKAGKKHRFKRVTVPLPDDSLLVKGKGNSCFDLKIPENTFVRFDDGQSTKIEATRSLPVSSLGYLPDEIELTLKGPMSRKVIPILPMEFDPTTAPGTDPKVLVFIKANDLNSLQKMVEKTFLHTDKDYYYPGEKIWYKVYLRYGSIKLKDSLSKVLHVELIGPEKKVIRNEILKIENGIAWGDIALPDSLKEGLYYLRAYTRWAMNFGNEYISMKPIPVLSTEQNVAPAEIKSRSGRKENVVIHTDKIIYKPREKIVVSIKMIHSSDEPIQSNISVSVTDADRVVPGRWNKSIVEDSFPSTKGKWKFKRITYPIEKAFIYNCYAKREFLESPATVLISSVHGNQTLSTSPGKDGRFNFQVDFVDTASFIFKATGRSGNFTGHVSIDQPNALPINLPAVAPDFLLRKDDARYHIQYSYDPNEKTTVLEEVVVRGSRLNDVPKRIYTSSIMMSPDHVFDVKALNMISESVQDPISFWQLMADRIPGARPDPNNLISLRRVFPGFRVNNLPYSADDMKALNPADIERVEVYNLLALINIYLKSGREMINETNEFDRYTLTGFALPSKFYMRDYSKANSDHELPDFRTTIYWDPDLVIDGEESTISFYAADRPAKYRIVAEGLTEKGEPVYGEQTIEVK